MCSLPAACAIVLYTKQGLALFESVPASQAATSPLCLASHSDVGEQKGSSPSTMSFDLCHPVRRTQVCLRPSSERWANPSVTPAKERGKENRVLEVGTGSNDDAPIEEGCEQQCRLPSSDVLRTEQKEVRWRRCSCSPTLPSASAQARARGLVDADICNCINKARKC
ncbi:uncharacterized [Tachysurus ichikawai]